jgi:GMP synthase-like glutamine amidotransferase
MFAGLGRVMQTFQWHGAEITELPIGAVVLARNDACPIQAIKWGRHAYGLQYHTEITPSTVNEWESEPAYKASLEQALGPTEAARLSEVVAPRLAAFRSSAQSLNDNFLTIVAERFMAAR